MPDSGEVYRALASRYGFGPDIVANMTADQQLMYFEDSQGKSVEVCGTMEEARALQAMLRGG